MSVTPPCVPVRMFYRRQCCLVCRRLRADLRLVITAVRWTECVGGRVQLSFVNTAYASSVSFYYLKQLLRKQRKLCKRHENSGERHRIMRRLDVGTISNLAKGYSEERARGFHVGPLAACGRCSVTGTMR